MAVDLRANFKASGERFYWDSTLVKLKEFVSKELKLSGRWASPGGDVKLFTADTVSLKWHGKTIKTITLAGNSTETDELSKILTSICETVKVQSKIKAAIQRDVKTTSIMTTTPKQAWMPPQSGGFKRKFVEINEKTELKSRKKETLCSSRQGLLQKTNFVNIGVIVSVVSAAKATPYHDKKFLIVIKTFIKLTVEVTNNVQ
ncbi:Hypothetical predicted protein [Paramuricea clavata]|uniref:Uncharacterized protein n=1 Tax=Paramuricea clavata TaxID=317549 RepID=A0A7D9JBV1_PARCT|nr:Hypothetical predicted protein [Paramuricea clavata]